jgi:hypothetical protein
MMTRGSPVGRGFGFGSGTAEASSESAGSDTVEARTRAELEAEILDVVFPFSLRTRDTYPRAHQQLWELVTKKNICGNDYIC